MEERKKKENYVMRHGISIALIGLFAVIFLLLQNIEIRRREPVEVIKVSEDTYYAYFNTLPVHMDTIMLYSQQGAALSYAIKDINKEKVGYRVCLQPSKNLLAQDWFKNSTRITGYLYTGKIKLWQLVFLKVK